MSNKIKKRIKNFDVITFTNVFAHIEDFKDLIQSLKNLVSDKTLIVIENHYLKEVIEKNQFDTFYHEHPRTYSLNSFNKISQLLGLNILDFNFVKRYNGNLRVFLSNSNKNSPRLYRALKKERKVISKYKNMRHKIKKWKKNKKKEIISLVKRFGPLPAKAFPGRASILINLLKLDNKTVSNIYEKNSSLKINHYAPGTNIKIIKEKFLKKEIDKKKIILNFAWHISKEIRNYLKNEFNYIW